MRARCIGTLSACALALMGCALTSKSEPLVPRYYSPARSGEAASAVALDAVEMSAKSAGGARRLRLGSIRAGSHLRERIVFRGAGDELGYYEGRRWTERPEVYLRRALAQALFEQRGLTRVVSGAALTLEIELVAFEEVRAPQPKARLEAVVLLHDERVVLLEETIAVEQPVRPTGGGDESASAVVAALAQALQRGVEQIADRVTEQIAARPEPERAGSPPTQPNPGLDRSPIEARVAPP